MPTVERLRIYPVKALDGQDVEAAEIASGGTLAGDREFAMFGPDGEPVNGKRTDRVHDLDASFDREAGTLSVSVAGRADRFAGERRTFDLRDDPAAAEEWLGAFFDVDLTLRRAGETGYVDRPSAGPSVISTATLEEVAGWYDGVTVDGLRRRLRANVEVGGVEPFWEDRFVGCGAHRSPDGASSEPANEGASSEPASEGAPAFRAGGVRFEGVEPCGRCVVPERDPDTGERDPGFRSRFVERRRETLPEWVDRDAFEHFYAVMLIADVPEASRGGTVRVGDPVEVVA